MKLSAYLQRIAAVELGWALAAEENRPESTERCVPGPGGNGSGQVSISCSVGLPTWQSAGGGGNSAGLASVVGRCGLATGLGDGGGSVGAYEAGRTEGLRLGEKERARLFEDNVRRCRQIDALQASHSALLEELEDALRALGVSRRTELLAKVDE